MYDERQTNSVFMAIGPLLDRYPAVAKSITAALEDGGIKMHPIAGTRNIWARDYMPLQVGNHFLKFVYAGYGQGCFSYFPHLKVKSRVWQYLGEDVRHTTIKLDGGNCQRDGDLAVITDKVFRDNHTIKKSELIDRLEKLLEARVVIVPTEPGDEIGHTDGALHFIPGTQTVLVNDYRRNKTKAYDQYAQKLEKALAAAGIKWELFPYAYGKCPQMRKKTFRKKYPQADTFNPGFGYYINFLLVGKTILLPVFGIPEDIEAVTCLKKNFKNYNIYPIDFSELSMEGGLSNCIAANYVL